MEKRMKISKTNKREENIEMANKEKDENILEVRNLNKNYKGFKLKDINLTLPKGMIMGLIGENGAGKTTTIKSILNLTKVDSGEVKIFGLNIKEDEKKIKEDIGVVLDDSFFSEHLTAEDINQIMKNIYENWDENLFNKYLVEFKLPLKQESKEFSRSYCFVYFMPEVSTTKIEKVDYEYSEKPYIKASVPVKDAEKYFSSICGYF